MLNEMKLYGVIGEDVTAVDVKTTLDNMDQTQPLLVRIHSEGGYVSDGLAIYDAIKSYKGPTKAIIESAAFSIASFIAMAFDDVEITENGYLMIHNPHMEVSGDDAAHSQASEMLSKMKQSMVEAYTRKTGKSEDEILLAMAQESWINASEAREMGFVNSITSPKTVRAVARLRNMPQGVYESLRGSDGSDACETRETGGPQVSESTKPVAASLAEIKAAFPKAKAEFVLSCLEKNLPMASVMTEALSAMEEELSSAKAKLAEYEQKMQAMESEKAESMKDAEPEAMEMEEDEEDDEVVMAKAKAKARVGVRPLAKSRNASGGMSAKAKWKSVLESRLVSGMSRPQAIASIDREFPGLREQMVEEVNQARGA